MRAARSPIGPAPVTSSDFGCHARARWPMRSVWSQALARMLAGSSNTPRMPSAGSLLDPAFGVAAVAAHVPLAGGAREARHRIGPAHDPDDEIANRKPAPRGRRFHRAQRFMAENEALLTGRGRAITPIEDFAIGPAYAERPRAHQDGPIRFRRVGDILELRRAGAAGQNGDCAHPAPRLLELESRRAPSAVKHSALARNAIVALSGKTPLTTPLRERQKKVPAGETKIGPSALSFLMWENGGAAWRPSDGGDGRSRRATFPPKARFPTARSSPTRPPASSTPASRTRASPSPSSSPTGSRSAPTA